MIRTCIFVLCLGGLALASYAKHNLTYEQLYQKAKTVANVYPDSAIYYGQLAADNTSQPIEQAKAHWLIGYYASKMGYYGVAIRHYQQAHSLYTDPLLKATMLGNMADSYMIAGNYREAIPIAIKATRHFAVANDSVKLINAHQLLANCYTAKKAFDSADSTFKKAMSLAQQYPENLASLYIDYAWLKGQLHQYSQAICYQRLGIEKSSSKDLDKHSMRMVYLAQYYLQAQQPDSSHYYLNSVLKRSPRSLQVRLFAKATQGVLYFVKRKEFQAYQCFTTCDSLLKVLSVGAPNPVQQKYVHKTAYRVYGWAYEILDILWAFGNKARFAAPRAWAKKRMEKEKEYYDAIQLPTNLQALLKDTPRTMSWKWILLIIVSLTITLFVSGGWMYTQRAKNYRERSSFLATLAQSPLKGFDELTPQEMAMLELIEAKAKKKLKLDEVKILLMIYRKYSYNQISVDTTISVGSIKGKVRRLKP